MGYNIKYANAEDDPLVYHRNKIAFVASQVQQLAFIVAVSASSTAIIYFVLGVHPYRFIVFFLFTLPFNINNLTILYLAVAKKKSLSSVDDNQTVVEDKAMKNSSNIPNLSSREEQPSSANTFQVVPTVD